MASVAAFPGSSALKSRIGLNSMKARRSASVKGFSATSSRQEKVALPLFSTFSTVWAIWLNGRSVLSSLTCPRLMPANPVSSAPVNPRKEGSPAMISIRGAADSNWLVKLATWSTGRNKQPVLFKELARAEWLDRFEVFGIAGQFPVERSARGVRQFRRRPFHDGQDRPVPIESLVELNVALAPIEMSARSTC